MLPISPSIALVANGEIKSYDKTKSLLTKFKKIVAVDGGLDHCDRMDIVPHLIVGDFDSVSEDALKKYAQVPILKYPRDKNKSDLELAIQEMLRQGADSIALFGVLGKRIDHLLYTLYLLARYPSKLIIESEEETIICLQNHHQIPSFPGQTISLIPLSEVSGVTTKNLQWELHMDTLDKKFMSLSNICLGHSFTVDIKSGNLLCCVQKMK